MDIHYHSHAKSPWNAIFEELRWIELQVELNVSKGRNPLDAAESFQKKDERKIKRNILKVRDTVGTVSCSRILAESGIYSPRISIWTGRRTVNRLGYRFLVSRKKGLLTSKDLVKWLTFADAMEKTKPKLFWTDDDVSFVHKYSPCSDSIAAVSRIWRNPSEGLAPGCTWKGSHVGSGGRTVKYL